MNEATAKAFCRALGGKVGQGTKKWVATTCLLAPWKHEGGKDSNPSGGVRIEAGTKPFYFCYACQTKMDLLELVYDIRRRKKAQPPPYPIDLAVASQIAHDAESVVDGLADDYTYEGNKKGQEFHPFAEAWLQSFAPAVGHPYLIERGVPDHVAAAFEIKWDATRERICFPYRDFNGRLAGMHGRAVSNENPLRYYSYDFGGKRNPGVWMGEHMANLDRPIVLTEGMFDMARIWQAYPNVLASRSSAINEEQFRRIKDCDFIITYYDYGIGGNKARETIDKHCGGKFIYHIAPDKDEKDAGATPVDVIKARIDEALV